MQPTQTGIAVALALAVVVFFFVFGGMSIFTEQTPPEAASPEFATTTNQNQSAPMPIENVTQLQMIDEIIGTGAAAVSGDTVTVNYVGSLTDGTIFDASAKHPETAKGFTFNLGAGKVIKGWDEGVVGMKVGGKRKLIIPAALGYGSQDYGPIPANSTLIFEVELLKVQKSAR
jgi:FKBP-type peptidyl-prolyl cis-trans isomerase